MTWRCGPAIRSTRTTRPPPCRRPRRRWSRPGLQIGMVTGNFDLLTADHPLAEPLLAAMDSANVRLLKLGYFRFEPQTMDYWEQVDNVRRAFAAWEKLASIYNVKICYHTHSHYCMGLNAAALMHLLRDFDPAYLGAYLDPGHFAVDGEPFDFGLAMAREHLSILSVKDVLIERVARKRPRCGQSALGGRRRGDRRLDGRIHRTAPDRV